MAAQQSFSGITFRKTILFFLAWTIWTAVYTWVMIAAGLNFRMALTDSIISNLLLAAAALLLTNLLKHYLPGKDSYINLIAIVAAISFLWWLVSRATVLALIRGEVFNGDFFEFTATVKIVITFLVLGCITLFFVLRRTLEDTELQLRRKADAEKLAKDAELFRLRQQLQPHFLFNSLNSISALVTREPAQARLMIEHLSTFLRSTVKKENEDMCTLEEEFRDLDLYLSIEKQRFGHRLSTKINIEHDAQGMKIPALLLQPIVENAIKHGVYDTTDEVNINISAEKKDQHLLVTVSNPFDPDTIGSKTGTGFGLAGVQRRLYLLFARTDLLKVSQFDHIFTTQITIPQA